MGTNNEKGLEIISTITNMDALHNIGAIVDSFVRKKSGIGILYICRHH